MFDIGRLMLDSGALTERQLDEAMRAKAVYGGRLGTNLVELGFVDEATLQAFLALQYGVNPMARDARPSPEALACIDAQHCNDLNVLPLQLEGQTLIVAMSDPSDTDALLRAQRQAGLPLRAVVASEGRLFSLMREVLGGEKPLRFAEVDAGARRAGGGDIESVAMRSILCDEAFAVPVDDFDEAELEFEEILLSQVIGSDDDWEDESLEIEIIVEEQSEPENLPTDFGSDLLTSEIDFHHATAPVAVSSVLAAHRDLEEGKQPMSFQDAVVAIQGCLDRDTLSRAVLRYALWHYRRAVLFTVQRGLALGWDALGDQSDRGLAQKLMIPLTIPSTFREVHEARQVYQGALSQTPMMKLFSKILGGEWPEHCLLVPFVVGQRVVALLYADGELNALTPERSSELEILSTQVSRAFGRFIAQLDIGTV